MSKYDDHVARMPDNLHTLILAIADNEGLSMREFCELMACAAKLGEISLRESYGPNGLRNSN